jgi:hypothetical protein
MKHFGRMELSLQRIQQSHLYISYKLTPLLNTLASRPGKGAGAIINSSLTEFELFHRQHSESQRACLFGDECGRNVDWLIG